MEELEGRGVIVRSVDEVRILAAASVLLIGHIIHTDLSDTIRRIDSDGAECVEIRVSMPEVGKPSTAMLTIAARSEEELAEAIDKLKEVCSEKGIEVIEPLDEEFV